LYCWRRFFSKCFWCFSCALQMSWEKVWLVEHRNKKCGCVSWFQSSWTFYPQQSNSHSESTIGFKGRIVFKTYNSNKPTNWGLCMFVLGECETRYILSFVPYFGSAITERLIRPDLPFTSGIGSAVTVCWWRWFSFIYRLLLYQQWTGCRAWGEGGGEIHLARTVNKSMKGPVTTQYNFQLVTNFFWGFGAGTQNVHWALEPELWTLCLSQKQGPKLYSYS
jgi:hypothetical protein